MVFPLLFAAVLALAAGVFVMTFAGREPGAALVGKTVTTGTATIGGPFTLVSSDGETVTDRSYRGKWMLIFFGYTSCPDVCPTSLNNISLALEALGPEADKLRPLFITVDPERDTPAVMARFLKAFDRRIVGLTGTQAQIDSVIKDYRVYAESAKTASSGHDYLMSHSGYVYLMDPQGQFTNVIQGSESGEEIAAWVRRETARAQRPS